MPENLESKVDLILARLETMRVNSTNWKVELRSSKMLNRQRGTPLERWKMASLEFNTQVNEAKATGEQIKKHCESKCKELENKLLYDEVYQRPENLRFYGIEETDEDENSLKVLQSFLERQCGIERVSACSQDWKTPRRW